ncbi:MULTISPECIES: 2-phosphosulfolactate phosphatase [unclassified Legionella]|uniref:2-phosphosulfolactate phosphatase n=1 Tax=unclassified Legionella TaxID=2622702 RepID=UPI001056C22E|nr:MULTISPECIES: 2-phosphosulfolactate phosphatase [unclassified Legionella]MDI9818023.1 2-phosphosulfolactate phosphatase [Legionella sp. PL877]
MSMITVEFALGLAGAEKAAEENHTAVIVDVLRASSTIVTLLDKGIKAIKPVNSTYGWQGLCIGEKNGQKLGDCHFNNSPAELREIPFDSDEILALKTTNGSGCIIAAKSTENHVLIGSALNAKACAILAGSIAKEHNGFLSLILAGRKGQIALDDLYAASIIFDNIPWQKTLTGTIKPERVDDLYLALTKTDSAKQLFKLGYEKDVLLCSQQDVTQTVPCYDGELIRRWHQ